MTQFPSLFVFLALLTSTSPATAEMIFKCVDVQGQLTYQSTDCRQEQLPAIIDTRYSNTGTLALEDAELLEQIHAERRERERNAVAQRDRAIQRLVAENTRSEIRCRALKDQLQLIYQKRRYQRIDRDEQDQLTREMREACSP